MSNQTDTTAPTASESSPETKPAEIVRETIQAPHKFSVDERLKLSEQLTQSMDTQDQIDREFDSVKQEFKSRVEKAQLETDNVRGKLRDGFEMRPTIARILFNTPHHGRKTFVRDDSGEIIREEAMTLADSERPLFRDKNGKDATAPKHEPEGEDEDDGEGDTTQLVDHTPGGADAGTTPLGDALDQAAALTNQPRMVLPNLDASDWEANALQRAFKKAAKAAGWSEAAIGLLKDQLKACDTVTAMQTTLRQHVIGNTKTVPEPMPQPTPEQVEPEPSTEAAPPTDTQPESL